MFSSGNSGKRLQKGDTMMHPGGVSSIIETEGVYWYDDIMSDDWGSLSFSSEICEKDAMFSDGPRRSITATLRMCTNVMQVRIKALTREKALPKLIPHIVYTTRRSGGLKESKTPLRVRKDRKRRKVKLDGENIPNVYRNRQGKEFSAIGGGQMLRTVHQK
jgi:hypothetical protein